MNMSSNFKSIFMTGVFVAAATALLTNAYQKNSAENQAQENRENAYTTTKNEVSYLREGILFDEISNKQNAVDNYRILRTGVGRSAHVVIDGNVGMPLPVRIIPCKPQAEQNGHVCGTENEVRNTALAELDENLKQIKEAYSEGRPVTLISVPVERLYAYKAKKTETKADAKEQQGSFFNKTPERKQLKTSGLVREKCTK